MKVREADRLMAEASIQQVPRNPGAICLGYIKCDATVGTGAQQGFASAATCAAGRDLRRWMGNCGQTEGRWRASTGGP